MSSQYVIKARRLIDGTGNEPIDFPVVFVKDGEIKEVGVKDKLDLPKDEDVEEIVFKKETILPGLVDSHLHLALGTGGGYEAMMRETDGIQLMTGIFNARQALHAGITTIKEAGARNHVALDLREGWKKGIIEAPRLVVSGRPITITGGHFHFCNDNEANGISEVRKKVRQLVKENVDVIKIMASGGGTQGTDNRQASYSESELKAIVEEAHKYNRTTFAHCEAFESIGNAARAGVDVLEHCGFILTDGTRGFDEKAVKTMVRNNLFYNPTLQTGSKILDSLTMKRANKIDLTEIEKQNLEKQEYKIRRKQENMVRMVNMGVQIVAGSDGIGLGNSNRLIRAMELMVEAGLTPMQVIISATSNGAKAMNMSHLFGTVKKGLKADIIAVEGDPLEDISALRSIKMVMSEGKINLFSN
jgi:imidazolonepropionase-like amidohydrolase